MSSKAQNKRKLSEELVPERQPNRRSGRLIKQLDNSLNSTLTCISSPNKLSPKVSPKVTNVSNLSQYFPAIKRNCCSPRNQLNVSSKFTRIKSPDSRCKKSIFTDEQNPITYGENSFEEYNERFDKNENILNNNKSNENNKNNKNSENCINSKTDTEIDFKKLLTSFHSIMDEVSDEMTDEEVHQSVDSMNFNNGITDCNENNITFDPFDDESDNRYNCVISSIALNATNIENTKTVPNSEEEFDLENDPNFDEMISRIDNRDLELITNKNVITKGSDDCEEFNFDDSFDRFVSEMPIPAIEETSVETKRNNDLDDDGFESDGDFELMVSKIKNEELFTQIHEQSKSVSNTRGQSSTHTCSASHSSSSFLTLSQIIQLINSPL